MKFYGIVGFWEGDEEVEDSPGIWKPKIVEKKYTGEVIRNNRRFQTATDQMNDDLVINNSISILSDLYMKQHWGSIRYVIWNGVKWTVSSVEVSYPRLTLEIGGVYHGDDEEEPEEFA